MKGEICMDIKQIAIKIQQNGGQLYLVGGAIRDDIMKRPIYDKDYCVTGTRTHKYNTK